MRIITDSAELAELCQKLAGEPYVTLDTEFIREKTYYPILCLVQIAGPDDAAAIDPLAEGIDLSPLYELLANPAILKVFHACRQDIEIFYQKTGRIPAPLFDTQIAAMVCGFGESVGYEALVNGVLRQSLDKSSRFTDWSQRPLTDKQIAYALADVTHLRFVYEKLMEQIESGNRAEWIKDEMDALAQASLYESVPEEAFARLKYRPKNAKVLTTLKAVAAWREREAQKQNVPRQRVLRDDVVIAIAEAAPQSSEDLQRLRGIAAQLGSRRIAGLWKALEEEPPATMPPREHQRESLPEGADAVIDLLRLLLKRQSEAHGIAPRLVAGRDDIEAIYRSRGTADIPALTGWRYDIFGQVAKALMEGKMTFAVDPKTGGIAIRDV